jgi:hypothetical protein
MVDKIFHYVDGRHVIGFCPQCQIVAVYSHHPHKHGWYCPHCMTQKLSMFEWDREEPHPSGVLNA